jgi:hypothetical protein
MQQQHGTERGVRACGGGVGAGSTWKCVRISVLAARIVARSSLNAGHQGWLDKGVSQGRANNGMRTLCYRAQQLAVQVQCLGAHCGRHCRIRGAAAEGWTWTRSGHMLFIRCISILLV